MYSKSDELACRHYLHIVPNLFSLFWKLMIYSCIVGIDLHLLCFQQDIKENIISQEADKIGLLLLAKTSGDWWCPSNWKVYEVLFLCPKNLCISELLFKTGLSKACLSPYWILRMKSSTMASQVSQFWKAPKTFQACLPAWPRQNKKSSKEEQNREIKEGGTSLMRWWNAPSNEGCPQKVLGGWGPLKEHKKLFLLLCCLGRVAKWSKCHESA